MSLEKQTFFLMHPNFRKVLEINKFQIPVMKNYVYFIKV